MGTSKKSKKRKRSSQAVAQEEEDVFAVELILKARVAEGAVVKNQDDHWEYYVKWAGYDSDANTWEPAKNFGQCERLVASFWEDVGWDNSDYQEGAEVLPSTKWTEVERKRFWQNLTQEERVAYKEKEAERRAQTQQRKAFEAAYGGHSVSSPEPSPEPQRRLKSKSKKVKKPRITKEEADDGDMPPIEQEKSKLKSIPLKRKETPWSSEDEPLDKRTKRKAKARKLSTPAESIAESSLRVEPKKPQMSTFPIEQPKVDKGKQKAVEELYTEPRPDSPSSLFSVDSSEDVAPPSPKPKRKPENRLAPERKLSSATAKSGSFKSSPTIPPKAPPHTYLKQPEPPSISPILTGIPTKQRLAAGASTFFSPKEAMASMSARTNAPASSSLSNLKFKKNSLTVIVPNESTVESPTIRPPDLTLNALNTSASQDSPVHMFTDSIQTEPLVGIESPPNLFASSPKALQHPNAHEADDFLASIATSLPGFAGPLEPASEPTLEPKPPPSLTAPRKTSSLPKIQKKWKWEGQLFVLKADDKEELVGSVVCTNVTTPKPRGMRIPLTLDAMPHRLNFVSFHDLSDVPIFLEACKTPDQFATLSGQDSGPQSQMKTITSYMAKHEQVALVPVWYDNNLVGHLLVFPPVFQGLVKQLEVPSETLAQAAEGLIVSLHGWIINTTIQQQESKLPLSDIVPAKTSLPPAFAGGRTQDKPSGPNFDPSSLLRRDVILQLALRALALPSDLFEWLTTSFRLYAVYHEKERGDDKSEPLELRMLKAILKGCQAREWKLKDHNLKKEYRLRVVFVHIGSIRNFSRSPLTQKRKSLDIRFYSYGTSCNVPRSMWGFKEIYPIGGVVTFYPSAFVEDYIGTIRLIQKIHEHPLWMAFISPTCLGYIVNVTCSKGQDPLVVYEQQGREFVYHCLLKLIAGGEIAQISAPSESSTIESARTWVRNHCRTFDPQDALSIGHAAFNSVCANAPQIDWVEMVQKNVDHDIIAFQRHPAILYEYRRFIVIKGEKDHANTPTSVEAATPRQFNFQDDYFKQKS